MVWSLMDPQSIAAWLDIAPSRHRSQLRAMWTLWLQFREAIEAGVKLADRAGKARTGVVEGGGA